MKNQPLVSVAVVTRNRKRDLQKCINSIINQTYKKYEVIIVDNASTDGTVEAIERMYPEAKIILMHRNLGCPEGRNVAFANCRGDIIVSIDDDANLAQDVLEKCIKYFEANENLAILGFNINKKANSSKSKKAKYTHLFSGGACAVRKAILQKTGYFPENFFRQAEEIDLALRIIDNGYTILFSPYIVVYHNAIYRNNKLFLYYACRNDLSIIILRYPLRFFPFVIPWKIFIWSLVGIKNFAIHYILWAFVSFLIKTPILIKKRGPVSVNTILSYIKNSLNFKFFKIKKYFGNCSNLSSNHS